MPHVIVKMWPGRSDELKARLGDKIVKDVMEVFQIGEEYVSLAFEETSPDEWPKAVYKPDIKDKWDLLHKRPGYEYDV